MSGKLDQSLGEVISAQRRSAGRRRSQRAGANGPKPAAPVGGIQKNAKNARGAAGKAAPARAATPHGESKVIVSNLPKDVSEQQIKEYFVQSVGPIKRVEISYGPNSQSRGIANVIFNKPDGASLAFQKLNGLLVDNRPIKIEIVVGAAQADKVMPAVKTLAERTSQPKGQAKSQPKSAATKQNKDAKGGVAKKGAAGKKGRGKSARPVKKTAEELDHDMDGYFKSAPADNATAPAAPAAAAAAAADATMEEDL